MRSLFLVLVCLAGVAFAQVVPRNEALTKAAQQVDEGDFEDAVRTIERGIDQPDLTDDQLAEM
ncbi:MAG TPA: hypothetical protein VGE37_01780, partial [Archangium sp.]